MLVAREELVDVFAAPVASLLCARARAPIKSLLLSELVAAHGMSLCGTCLLCISGVDTCVCGHICGSAHRT